MNRLPQLLLMGLWTLGLFAMEVKSQEITLSSADIVVLSTKDKLVDQAIKVLKEEIEKRSHISLKDRSNRLNALTSSIVVGLAKDQSKLSTSYQKQINALPALSSEGYKILSDTQNHTVIIIGQDPRGVLYGIGKLLRKLTMRKGEIHLVEPMTLASSPQYPIRGHQLGYRPKTNAYDAWTPDQYDQYIRDLAIFGANSIEIMPPETDDAARSAVMQWASKDMIIEQSKICDRYGLDVWMWFPNMADDYDDPVILAQELEQRREVFQSIPRLDALFVPGGDPGHLAPDELFSFLAKEAKVLKEYHPKAKIWVSPQFSKPTKAWYDAFFHHVNQQYDWFGGLVFGPWIKIPLPQIRTMIDPAIPIRRYPDITHNVKCQYPIPHWDLALANTLDRESINPRPIDQKIIHNSLAPYAQGSISYSEGINDDVNKFIWSNQDWNASTSVVETLKDYSRYFIHPDFATELSQGLLLLEENLRGSLLTNEGVLRTLQQWQALEHSGDPLLLNNYRFQLGLIRAYFDAYQFRRLRYETELEAQARDLLLNAENLGSLNAIQQATEILSRARTQPVQSEWKQRCEALADSLFKNIGAQLTVEKHHGARGRGNIIDYIDVPLNDVFYLLDQFQRIESMNNEAERLSALKEILHRTDPGPGGYYDNFGTAQSWSKVKSNYTYAEDPGTLISPRVSFGVGLRGDEWRRKVKHHDVEGYAWPLAWMNHVTALYDQPLKIEYNHLDPSSEYRIKVAYTGRFSAILKMEADDVLVHDYLQTGSQPIYEFDIPQSALADGSVIFTWTCSDGQRGAQVSEIWIEKK